MGKEFWAARRPGWVLGGLVVMAVALTTWLFREKSGANIANILALTVSIVSLAVTVRGLLPSPPIGRAARELADRVVTERGRARRQALGMSGDVRPTEITFRSPLPEAEPELVRWRSDGGAELGTSTDVADYYRSLDRGRLVILGEPGAGKTVLATQLVIDLVEGLPTGELQPTARPAVPVWLSLPSLNLGDIDSLVCTSAEDIATQIDQWIAAQISAVYQIPKPTAEMLIRGRWILPVLDGLDEMDAPASDGASGPARPQAAAVVRALNSGTGRRPVVLVCRRAEYIELARATSITGEDPVLQDANQIVLQPLDVPAICNYLTRRFPGRRPGELAARWENVQHTLQSATTPESNDSLAGVLSSPWRLFLAAAAYQDDQSDPDELIRIPADTVGDQLLMQLIPALTLRTPRRSGGHYPPDKVHTWLSTLAQHLDQTSKHLHWSATDFHPQDLWPIAGKTTVRLLCTITFAAILITGCIPLYIVWVHRYGHWYPFNPLSWIGLLGLICGIIFTIIFFTFFQAPLDRYNIWPASVASRRRLAVMLPTGLVTGLVVGLIPSLAYPLAYSLARGLAFGLAFGLVLGLVLGLRAEFSFADRPTSVMRQNITFSLVSGVAFGLGGGIFGLVFGPTAGLATGLLFGLALGLITGLAVWIRYMIGCCLARLRGMLPRRVGQFLDWTYSASLLRMSGTAVQFRHRELQDWLIRNSSDFSLQAASDVNKVGDVLQGPIA